VPIKEIKILDETEIHSIIIFMRVKSRLIIQASSTITRNASILVKSFTGFLSVKNLIKTRKRDLSIARSAAATLL
jgi:hypothetical protein